jgi:hypothetical protein
MEMRGKANKNRMVATRKVTLFREKVLNEIIMVVFCIVLLARV